MKKRSEAFLNVTDSCPCSNCMNVIKCNCKECADYLLWKSRTLRGVDKKLVSILESDYK